MQQLLCVECTRLLINIILPHSILLLQLYFFHVPDNQLPNPMPLVNNATTQTMVQHSQAANASS